MSLILKVTAEEVRSKASEINAQKDAMSTYLQDMQGKVNTLQEAWNSPSGQKYVEKFNLLAKEIQDALEEIQKNTQNLNDAATQYETIENTQSQAVDSLSTDNIF